MELSQEVKATLIEPTSEPSEAGEPVPNKKKTLSQRGGGKELLAEQQDEPSVHESDIDTESVSNQQPSDGIRSESCSQSAEYTLSESEGNMVRLDNQDFETLKAEKKAARRAKRLEEKRIQKEKEE